jgi:hypothetical protein
VLTICAAGRLLDLFLCPRDERTSVSETRPPRLVNRAVWRAADAGPPEVSRPLLRPFFTDTTLEPPCRRPLVSPASCAVLPRLERGLGAILNATHFLIILMTDRRGRKTQHSDRIIPSFPQLRGETNHGVRGAAAPPAVFAFSVLIVLLRGSQDQDPGRAASGPKWE